MKLRKSINVAVNRSQISISGSLGELNSQFAVISSLVPAFPHHTVLNDLPFRQQPTIRNSLIFKNLI